MTFNVKTLFLCVSVGIAIGFASSKCSAQSTGPAALAAKQQIKAQVLSALGDGKITQDERRNILLKAKEICSAKEYFGLVETLNRLSPPDHPTPEDLGYTSFVDKQLMAKYPLSWLEKMPANDLLPKQSFASNIIPNQPITKESKPKPKQTVIVREIITKQTIVKETIPQQSIAKQTTSKSKKSVMKEPKTKQTVAKETKSKQTVAKKTKPNATSKVAILSAPPQQNKNKQTNPSTKPVQQKIAESPKKPPVTGEQVTIQQPDKLLKEAERAGITHSYTDHSVPVLTSPSAALLSTRKSNAIKASYDQSLEPETSPSIIK